MSGHSKWAKIKHQKGLNDAKKGAIFTKLAKNITLAAKEGGGDVGMNFALRLAVNKAKDVNMPSDNIDRAIKKAAGGADKTVIQKVSYEAMKGTVGIIIDCNTDNVNRAVAEVKRIVENAGWKIVSVGSVSWNFVERGYVSLRPQKRIKAVKFGAEDTYEDLDSDEVELKIMEINGVEDIEREHVEDDNMGYELFGVYTDKNSLTEVAKQLENDGYRVESVELVKISKDLLEVSENVQDDFDKLSEALEELEDFDEIWSNIK